MSENEQDYSSRDQRMYQTLKRLWMSSQSHQSLDPEEYDAADLEFEQFIDRLIQMEPQRVEEAYQSDGSLDGPRSYGELSEGRESEQDEPQITQTQLLMEIILELDQSMSLVPPRVAAYRDLLAKAGLDRAASDHEGEGSEPGQKGLAGINLADQASLEFHSNMLGMAFSIAKDAAIENLKSRSQSTDWTNQVEGRN